MGFGRTLGKTLLKISREADRLGEGLDTVFGEGRTRPGDGFSRRRTGQRAANFTGESRENVKRKTGKLMEGAKEKKFFDSKKGKDREFI